MLINRTDLALEAKEIYERSNTERKEIDGVTSEQIHNEYAEIYRVNIINEEGERTLSKKMGKYITITAPSLRDNNPDVYEACVKIVSEELLKVLNLKENSVILIVGLGNRLVTPDALGPKVVEKVMITRHLKQYMPEYIGDNIRPVCAVAPGVLGITGVETCEIVKGVCERVSPDVIIVIDALASRQTDRLTTTIQITDTGIIPGGGVGNKRMGIDKDALGIPVIAVGVPMVVDAATIASDSIDAVIERYFKGDDSTDYKRLSEDEKYELIKAVLAGTDMDFIVTPKEIDTIIEKMSKVIANGINLAVHKGITMRDVDDFNSI